MRLISQLSVLRCKLSSEVGKVQILRIQPSSPENGRSGSWPCENTAWVNQRHYGMSAAAAAFTESSHRGSPSAGSLDVSHA